MEKNPIIQYSLIQHNCEITHYFLSLHIFKSIWWILQGSNDERTWEILDEQHFSQDNQEFDVRNYYPIQKPAKFKSFLIAFKGDNENIRVSIAHFNLFGTLFGPITSLELIMKTTAAEHSIVFPFLNDDHQGLFNYLQQFSCYEQLTICEIGSMSGTNHIDIYNLLIWNNSVWSSKYLSFTTEILGELCIYYWFRQNWRFQLSGYRIKFGLINPPLKWELYGQRLTEQNLDLLDMQENKIVEESFEIKPGEYYQTFKFIFFGTISDAQSDFILSAIEFFGSLEYVE